MSEDDDHPVVHGGFSTTDPQRAEEFLSGTYVDQRLRLTGPRENFTAAVASLAAPGLAVSRLRTGAGLVHTVDDVPEDVLIVSAPRRGHIDYLDHAHTDACTVTGGAVLSPPSGGVHVESENLDITIVTLDRDRVAGYAEATTGIGPGGLAFHDLTARAPALATRWSRAVAHVHDDVLADPWSGAQPILLDQAFRTLCAALLSTFPNTAHDRTDDPERRPPRGEVPAAALREVLEYLDHHADRPVGPAEIADHADAPYPEIVEGLRRRYGRHPAELLWRARLRGLRRDLHDADPLTTRSLAGLAARWGFDHVDRLRIAYVLAFGERPEDTLAH